MAGAATPSDAFGAALGVTTVLMVTAAVLSLLAGFSRGPIMKV